MKRESLKKLTNLSLSTIITCTPMTAPLLIYGANGDLLDTEESLNVVKEQEAVNQLEISQNVETVGNENSIFEELDENRSVKSDKETFSLSDWSYKEENGSILLREYIGDKKDIYIPGEFDGKQVILDDLKDLLPSTTTDLKIEAVNGKKVKLQRHWMTSPFKGNKTIRRIDLRGLDTSNITSMHELFADTNLAWLDLRGLDTSNVTTMYRMFYNSRYLSVLDLSSFNTSKVTNMIQMFYGTDLLVDLNISSFNTSNVENMNRMFAGSSSLTTLDLSHFNTSKVVNMYDMFMGMDSLAFLDLSSFDTSNVTDMSGMFSGMDSLTSVDLSSFETSNVTNMSGMFSGTNLITSLDLSSFDTSKVTDMSYMFSNMKKLRLLDLSSFQIYSQTNVGKILSCSEYCDNLIIATEDDNLISQLKRATDRSFQPFRYSPVTYKTQVISGEGIPGAKMGVFSKNGERIAYGSVNKDGHYELKIPKQKLNSTIKLKMSKSGYQEAWKELRVLNEIDVFTYTTPTISTTTMSGKGVVGAKVGVYDKNGNRLGVATVNNSGRYNLTIPKQNAGSVLKIKQEKNGYLTLSKTVTVLNEFKDFTIKNASISNVAIYGTGEPGANVKAFVDGKAISSLTQVNLKGNYKIAIPKQKAGTVVQVKMAKEGYLTTSKNITVLNEFKTFTYNTPSSSTTTISGKGVIGAKVGIYDKNGKRLAITTVNSKGNYKLTIPKQKVGTVLTLKQAKSGYLTASKNVTVLNELKAFEITTKINAKTTAIYGKGVAGAKVGIYDKNGKRLAITTVNSKGNYKLVIPKQKVGTKLTFKQAKSGYLTLSKTITVVK